VDKVSPGGRPTLLNHGNMLRMNGLDVAVSTGCGLLWCVDLSIAARHDQRHFNCIAG
jgi:hypothetical protein